MAETDCDDDHELRRFRQQRDEPSFRRLYRRHTPRLFALAVRLCGNRTEAEELVQECWTRAVAGDDFDGRSRYGTWLTGILINCSREGSRAGAREVPLESHKVTALHAAPGNARLDLEQALMRLPAGYREVILLHDLFGHTHAEIGAMLGIGAGTSKSQLHRARQRVREWLAPGDTEGGTYHGQE